MGILIKEETQEMEIVKILFFKKIIIIYATKYIYIR